MRDTVTTLPPVNVPGTRSIAPNRQTATTVRIDRSQANRFLPLTIADALDRRTTLTQDQYGQVMEITDPAG